jgi:diguanylate cyclase (GGDEF)-like protein/PAS domain S-box-containing protein
MNHTDPQKHSGETWPLYEGLLGLFLFGIMALTLHSYYTTERTLIERQYVDVLDVAYRAALQARRLDVETRFRLQIDQSPVLEILQKAQGANPDEKAVLRGQLFRLLRPVYSDLEQAGLAYFQFHLVPDEVFLRFHAPEQAGDALMPFRPLIQRVHATQQPLSGFEIGRTLPGFRYLFPILKEGVLLGCVEFALPFDRIAEHIGALLGKGDFLFIINESSIIEQARAIDREKFSKTPLHRDFVIENPLISRIARHHDPQKIEWLQTVQAELGQRSDVQKALNRKTSFRVEMNKDGEIHSVTFLAITDSAQKPVAYIIHIAQNGILFHLRQALTQHLGLGAVLIVCLCITVYALRRKGAQLRDDLVRRTRLQKELDLYANIFRHTCEAIVVTDRENRIVTVNPAFTEITGYALDMVKGKNPRMFASGKTPKETHVQLWRDLAEKGYWQGEFWDQRRDGSIFPKWTFVSALRNEQGETEHYIASFTDITQHKAAQARIERLALYDTLTGLLNRHSLETRLSESVVAADRQGQSIAVLFIDMDRFKQINDGFGHAMGDALLVEVALRLKNGVRETDIVGRLGGDEFVVILTQLGKASLDLPTAWRLLESLGKPYVLFGETLHSSPSIGVAFFPEDGSLPETLIKKADQAMYRAKEEGRNRLCFFSSVH